jgi:hypothetical protein
MKTCKKIKDLLPLYINNDVTEDERETVSAHLEECPACREYQLSLAAIIRAMKPDRIEVPVSYGAELVVALQERLKRRVTRQKRWLWAIPAFSSLAVVILIASIVLLKPRSVSDRWVSGLLQEQVYLDLAEIGYFGEILIDRESNSDLVLSTREFYRDAVNWIFNNSQSSDIDSYLLATTNLSDNDYSQVIKQLHNTIL